MSKKNELQALDPDMAAMMEMSSVNAADLRKSIHDEDKREPRMQLVQAMSELATAGEASPGSIAHGADGYIYAGKGEVVTVIPLLYFKTRRRYEERDEETDAGVMRILCESRGGRVGNGDPGGDCGACTFSQWKDKPDGTRKPPECDAQHNFLVYVPSADEGHSIAVVTMGRTSYGTGTKLVNKLFGLQGVFWMYAFQLCARHTEKGKAKWFVYDLKQWDDSNKFEKLLPELYPETWKQTFGTCESFFLKCRDAYDFSGQKATKTVANSIETGEVPF